VRGGMVGHGAVRGTEFEQDANLTAVPGSS
jgi:hypothetical protein